MNNKNGFANVFIAVGIVVIMLIIVAIALMYFQVNGIYTVVKQDLFFALQNGQLAFVKEDLALGNYNVNYNILKQQIEDWSLTIVKSHPYMKQIKLTKLDTAVYSNSVDVGVKLDITFKPLIALVNKQYAVINIEETLNLALLKYNEGG